MPVVRRASALSAVTAPSAIPAAAPRFGTALTTSRAATVSAASPRRLTRSHNRPPQIQRRPRSAHRVAVTARPGFSRRIRSRRSVTAGREAVPFPVWPVWFNRARACPLRLLCERTPLAIALPRWLRHTPPPIHGICVPRWRHVHGARRPVHPVFSWPLGRTGTIYVPSRVRFRKASPPGLIGPSRFSVLRFSALSR
jgi:hypothetical protein